MFVAGDGMSPAHPIVEGWRSDSDEGLVMASDRVVYHVVPNADQSRWVVSLENDDRFREEYETKQAAVEAAKTRARTQEPSQVKVHGQDGNMEYESTYGDDPRRTPG
jgi:hypothetical protein